MTARIVPITAFAFLLATLLNSQALRAQTGATLAGTITTSSGAALSGAKISAKNLNTGAVAEAQSDASGHFTLSSLIVGDYEVTIAAETFAPKTMKVTVATSSTQELNAVLSGAQNSATGNLPNAPSSARSRRSPT